MRIKTTGQINARTQDGRELTAEDGELVEIDADDAGMVGLAKSLIMCGQAVHYGDAGDVDEELTEAESEPEPESAPAGEEDPEDLDEDDES